MEIRNRSKITQILVKIVKYWNGNLKQIIKYTNFSESSKIFECKFEIDQKILKSQ